MRTTSGACVRRARFAAADGMPIPTKQTVPFLRRRDASMVMISVAVYSVVLVSGICNSLARRGHAGRFQELRVILGTHHMLLHPRAERITIARHRIPRLAESVVAAVVAVGIRRMRAIGH